MNRKFLVFATALAFVFSFAIAGGIAKANNGPAEIVVKQSGPDVKKKGVNFSHAKHQEKHECQVCHHTDAGGKQGPYKAGEEKACQTCHSDAKALKKAAHGVCLTCHKKHKPDAPTSCNKCHTVTK